MSIKSKHEQSQIFDLRSVEGCGLKAKKNWVSQPHRFFLRWIEVFAFFTGGLPNSKEFFKKACGLIIKPSIVQWPGCFTQDQKNSRMRNLRQVNLKLIKILAWIKFSICQSFLVCKSSFKTKVNCGLQKLVFSSQRKELPWPALTAKVWSRYTSSKSIVMGKEYPLRRSDLIDRVRPTSLAKLRALVRAPFCAGVVSGPQLKSKSSFQSKGRTADLGLLTTAPQIKATLGKAQNK